MDEAISNRETMAERYRTVRAESEALAANLSPEDMVLQSMTDASPAKWHLGHVSWAFEAFVLGPHLPGYRPYHPGYAFLFNSYYEQAGPRQPRPRRGMLSRPSVEEIMAYRAHVDDAMEGLMEEERAEVVPFIELALNHEQQHQELLLTDILHAFSFNPMKPVFKERKSSPAANAPAMEMIPVTGGLHEIGHEEGQGFAYDNEGPRHKVYLDDFKLASRLVTNGEWKAFMEDGGYRDPLLWLSDGWAQVNAEGWRAPLYWEEGEGGWQSLTLGGPSPVEDAAPVTHISYFEADAYARWAAKRLPREGEWEAAAKDVPIKGNTLGTGQLRPRPASPGPGLQQLYGDVWEWTMSAYSAHPGFKPLPGVPGEYNGKFMSGQFVLKGGSCATPDGHIRASYRNFFYPHQRWQFSGLRLAEDA